MSRRCQVCGRPAARRHRCTICGRYVGHTCCAYHTKTGQWVCTANRLLCLRVQISQRPRPAEAAHAT
ncbi:MAG: hypothetical protein KKB13_04165 [Chloroflexi bacterium]|nr:hypothetical protein [Chloroflexota bacterium]